MFDSDTEQVCLVQKIQSMARCAIENNDFEQAERLYYLALNQAETLTGENSFLTGLVLFDLALLFDSQQRHNESKMAWRRVRRIVMLQLEKHVS